jgi:hypothetical protein
MRKSGPELGYSVTARIIDARSDGRVILKGILKKRDAVVLIRCIWL